MKSYVLMANFSLAAMDGLRCRAGLHTASPPPFVDSVGNATDGDGDCECTAAPAECTVSGISLKADVEDREVLGFKKEAPEIYAKGLPPGSEGVETSYMPTAEQGRNASAELQQAKCKPATASRRI